MSNNISFDKWKNIGLFANKVGAITCTNYGAIASMPTLNEFRRKCLKKGTQ